MSLPIPNVRLIRAGSGRDSSELGESATAAVARKRAREPKVTAAWNIVCGRRKHESGKRPKEGRTGAPRENGSKT